MDFLALAHWCRLALGCLFVYAACFLYEDEEGRFQNRLEEWHAAALRKRESISSKSSAFVGAVAALTSSLFDRLFGKRLVSARGVGVSICFSMASVMLTMQVISIFRPNISGPPTLALWLQVIVLVVVGIMPSMFYERDRAVRWVWGIAVICLISIPVLRILTAIERSKGLRWSLGVFLFVLILLAVSFACDVGYIALTRWMLRKASESAQMATVLGLILINCLLGIALLLGPLVIGVLALLTVARLNGPTWVGALTFAVVVGGVFNSVDVVACSLFVLVLLTVILNGIVWSAIARPLHAVKRFELIKQKKLLWACGLGLLFGPKGMGVLKAVLSKLAEWP